MNLPIDWGAISCTKPVLNNIRQTGNDTHEMYCAAGCIVTSLNSQILAENKSNEDGLYIVMNILPLSHTDIPLSIMKLSNAIIIPSRAKKTQSSPNFAKEFFHRKDIAFANFPVKHEIPHLYSYIDQIFVWVGMFTECPLSFFILSKKSITLL